MNMNAALVFELPYIFTVFENFSANVSVAGRIIVDTAGGVD
jgi:hypothetical protein